MLQTAIIFPNNLAESGKISTFANNLKLYLLNITVQYNWNKHLNK